MKPLVEGDRIVVKFRRESVMGYFLRYYNGNYVICTLDDEPERDTLSVERRRVSKAPANVQIFEAARPDLAGAAGTSTGGDTAAPIPAPTTTRKQGGLNG